MDAVGNAVGADWTIKAAIAVGVGPGGVATLGDVEDAIIVAVEVNAVSDTVAIGIAVITGRGRFNRIGNAVVVVVQVNGIIQGITIGVDEGSTRGSLDVDGNTGRAIALIGCVVIIGKIGAAIGRHRC